MKEVILLVALIFLTSQQSADYLQGSCQVCKPNYILVNGQCNKNQPTQGNYQSQFKNGSNQNNTQVNFSKSAADAQRAGDIRSEMRANWPPRNTNNIQARLLQGIDWNQAVQWVYSTTSATNLGWLTLFQIYFANDCPQQAYVTLRIQSTGPMWVYVNGVYYYFSWGGIGNLQTVTFPVRCGGNLIEVYVYNECFCKAGIRFQILQNYCYSCSNTLSGFYNRQTCRCQCISQCQCNNPLAWVDYPTCSCKCPFQQSCIAPKLWHSRRCRCQCPPVSCPRGLVVDPSSCTCVRPPCQPYQCPFGSRWESSACGCVPCQPYQCPSDQIWSGCGCIPCPTQSCPFGQVWRNCRCEIGCNALTCPLGQIWSGCGCIPCPTQSCPFGQVWRNCRCEIGCNALTCPLGQIWSGCSCIPCPTQSCPFGQVWRNCRCEFCQPPAGGCQRGYFWQNCQCTQEPCAPGFFCG